ncbi:hypothetical protein ACFFGH_26010 [Lysobacter korlensis]|uniref:Uncharacterized protein n=1 Tax=Lysobacter korlensis TaxID=553636 RepID=A0ABV6RWY8_9GAMM
MRTVKQAKRTQRRTKRDSRPTPITAAMQGRHLRLTLTGSGESFLVPPLPAKRGQALARTLLQLGSHDEPGRRSQVFAEALGPGNYALITGDHVQEFGELGNYVHTWLPGARMIEPAEAVPAPAAGERIRIIPAPWDGLNLREEEVEALALAAYRWQSPAGWRGLELLLRGQASQEATAMAPLLLLAP